LKILDKYIFKAFLQKFLVIFVILMLLMILQMIWLYISELAGKDLEISVILRFIVYASPNLVPLTLPLAILFTSIMVFGEFSEHYELAAIKSTGISLQRAMRSLIVFMVLLGISMFFFANDVIPASQRKFISLRKDIFALKPARIITVNQFNELGDINIKVADKYGSNDQFLSDVLIHKRDPKRSGNYTVIKSEKGELISSVKSDLLSLVLTNGNYYEEVNKQVNSTIGDDDDDKKDIEDYPFVKTYFEKYAINIDLSDFNKKEVSENQYTKNRKMLKASVLVKDIDSFALKLHQQREILSKKEYRKLGVHLASNQRIANEMNCAYLTRRDLPENPEDFFDFETQEKVLERALSDVQKTTDRFKTYKKDLRRKVERINKFEIALHEKYVLGFSCIVLFFVGAPLGSIIRKGGIGLPLIYALGIFLVYHFIGIFAKNSAEDGSISPFLSCWLSTFIVLPIGILLTYKATTEKDLISSDFFYHLFQKLKRFFKKRV